MTNPDGHTQAHTHTLIHIKRNDKVTAIPCSRHKGLTKKKKKNPKKVLQTFVLTSNLHHRHQEEALAFQ